MSAYRNTVNSSVFDLFYEPSGCAWPAPWKKNPCHSFRTGLQYFVLFVVCASRSRYPYAEAEGLLQDQLETARKNVEEKTSDLAFLRDQITTTEVNVARVYNYDVQERKRKREEEAANAAIQKSE